LVKLKTIDPISSTIVFISLVVMCLGTFVSILLSLSFDVDRLSFHRDCYKDFIHMSEIALCQLVQGSGMFSSRINIHRKRKIFVYRTSCFC